jgi:hypothetical protein
MCLSYDVDNTDDYCACNASHDAQLEKSGSHMGEKPERDDQQKKADS